MLLRLALGKPHPTPRIFQVPGPLHLEHPFYRRSEILAAGPSDFWIASSRCILRHYRDAGVTPERVFLSYYGTDITRSEVRATGFLRHRLQLDERSLVVGNVSHMYRPRYSLGQFRGLKNHETLIDALGIVIRNNSRVVGVLIGGAWDRAQRYEQALRHRAAKDCNGRLLMLGAWERDTVISAWPDFDCAVHVPFIGELRRRRGTPACRGPHGRWTRRRLAGGRHRRANRQVGSHGNPGRSRKPCWEFWTTWTVSWPGCHRSHAGARDVRRPPNGG